MNGQYDEPPPPDSDTVVRPRPRSDAMLRVLAGAGVALFFVCALAFLVFREVLLPRINDYRPAIVSALSHAVGLQVSIDRISADWQGFRPRMHLSGLVLFDREGEAALRLETVDATLAWSSALRGEVHFDRLVVFSPQLSLGRDADGTLMIAGLPISGAGAGGGFATWLLRQREIVIQDANLSWNDRTREAPELVVDSLNLRISRVGGRYRFGMQGRPGPGIAEALDIRGDLVGPASVDYAQWGGQIYLALLEVELGALAPWVDYPIPVAGAGEVRVWADLARGNLSVLVADIAMNELAVRLHESLPPLEAFNVQGRLAGERQMDSYSLLLRGVELTHREGSRLAPLNLDLTLRDAAARGGGSGLLRFNTIDVPVLVELAPYVPLPERVRDILADFAPRGRLEDVRLDWGGGGATGADWNLRAKFSEVAIRQQGSLPGIEGITGELEGHPRAGRFRLSGRDAAIDMPAVFPEPRLTLTELQADGGWVRETDGRLAIMIDSARFENPDASGGVSGVYYPDRDTDGRGAIDLAARLTRAEGDAVWRYLPWVVNENTRDWLRSSLRGAKVSDTRLTLRGDLDDFPFEAPDTGEFLVTVDFSDGRLDYAPGWPGIDSIEGSLRFEGAGMRVEAATARVFGVDLRDVVAEIPDLGAASGQIMTVRGDAVGPTSEFLRFIAESPVGDRIGRFTADMDAQGRGALTLGLSMPLHDAGRTGVNGEFRFSGNTVKVLDWLPPLAEATGRVVFSERAFSIPEARARLFNEDLTLTASTSETGVVGFTAKGGLSVRALRQHHDLPLLEHLSGTTSWQSDIEVSEGTTTVSVRSALAGISSSLPYPLNKRSADQWPLDLSLVFGREGLQTVRAGLQDRLVLDLKDDLGSGSFRVTRGGIGVFAPLSLVDGGVKLTARLDGFDLDAWRALIGPGADEAGPDMPGWITFAGMDLSARSLRAFGQDFSDFELGAMLGADGWSGRVSSAQMNGTFDWKGSGDGSLGLRLDRLELARRDVSDTEISRMMEIDPSRSLPDLDVIVERFDLRGRDLGRLELQARNRGALWELDSVSLSTPEATLNGSGRWRAGANPRTDLALRLETSDVGALLGRVGYAAAVSEGSALLEGGVSWRGVPTRIHLPSLTGALDLDARNGRFSQLDPGVGRLLGVLSLQSLPRRLKLDFSDVFSEGFAFDSVSGSMDLASGLIATDDLMISGPSARIWLHGTANLLDETQDLKVVVQPTLSESVAVGAAAAVINPVAGVIAFLAQKVLSDPIERMFAFGYAITGGWADPQVEKLPVGPRAGQTQPGEQQ